MRDHPRKTRCRPAGPSLPSHQRASGSGNPLVAMYSRLPLITTRPRKKASQQLGRPVQAPDAALTELGHRKQHQPGREKHRDVHGHHVQPRPAPDDEHEIARAAGSGRPARRAGSAAVRGWRLPPHRGRTPQPGRQAGRSSCSWASSRGVKTDVFGSGFSRLALRRDDQLETLRVRSNIWGSRTLACTRPLWPGLMVISRKLPRSIAPAGMPRALIT